MAIGQRIFTTKSNQQAVQGFPVNRFYTKAESDARFAPIGGGGSQTPWTSNIDADGYKLQDLGDIEFRSIGELLGFYNALGTQTFHGAGLNDLTYTGIYTGTGTPTYRFTVTNLNTQQINVDDDSNIFAGDSITGDQTGSTGTVLFSSGGRGTIILESITGDFSLDTSLTDTSTSTNVNVNSVGPITDIGTFTDGTTTDTFQAIKGLVGTLQGVSYGASAYTGHTVSDYWEMTITPTLGHGLLLDFANNFFSLGDHEQKIYGNEIITDINGGASRWQMKDKNGTYFSMKSSGQNPTFSGLGGSGAGRFVGLDNNGLMSNVASPLTIGNAVGGSSANGFYLFSDGSGKLAQGNSTVAGIQQISGNIEVFAGGFFVSDQSGNLFYDFDLPAGAQAFRIGDLSGVGSGAKLNMDIQTGDFNFSKINVFTLDAQSATIGDILGVGAGGTLLIGGATGLTSSIGMDWDFGGSYLKSIADPVNPQDAATKNYVDGKFASGISTTITTAKLTIAGTNGSMTFTNGLLTAQTPAT